jgi:hypothetical protein
MNLEGCVIEGDADVIVLLVVVVVAVVVVRVIMTFCNTKLNCRNDKEVVMIPVVNEVV